MSSRPREPERDEPADDQHVEPDWIERLRLARARQTREWGRRFGGGGAFPDAEDVRSAKDGGPAPDPQADPEDDAFFDQDAARPPGRRPARGDAFYDQDEEPWT